MEDPAIYNGGKAEPVGKCEALTARERWLLRKILDHNARVDGACRRDQYCAELERRGRGLCPDCPKRWRIEILTPEAVAPADTNNEPRNDNDDEE